LNTRGGFDMLLPPECRVWRKLRRVQATDACAPSS
jgi:hypothetical protein